MKAETGAAIMVHYKCLRMLSVRLYRDPKLMGLQSEFCKHFRQYSRLPVTRYEGKD